MILQILSRTPLWVFALFALLVALGLQQSRPREIGRTRVAVLPAIFLPLSLLGVWNAFGAEALAFAGWLAGVGAALLANRYAGLPRKVSYAGETRRFRLEGSWVPLGMMMAIFFLRYAIAVSIAMRPALTAAPAFIAAVGFAYGLISGSFLARALRTLAAARPGPDSPA
jgi:hypothetical protein